MIFALSTGEPRVTLVASWKKAATKRGCAFFPMNREDCVGLEGIALGSFHVEVINTATGHVHYACAPCAHAIFRMVYEGKSV